MPLYFFRDERLRADRNQLALCQRIVDGLILVLCPARIFGRAVLLLGKAAVLQGGRIQIGIIVFQKIGNFAHMLVRKRVKIGMALLNEDKRGFRLRQLFPVAPIHDGFPDIFNRKRGQGILLGDFYVIFFCGIVAQKTAFQFAQKAILHHNMNQTVNPLPAHLLLTVALEQRFELRLQVSSQRGDAALLQPVCMHPGQRLQKLVAVPPFDLLVGAQVRFPVLEFFNMQPGRRVSLFDHLQPQAIGGIGVHAGYARHGFPHRHIHRVHGRPVGRRVEQVGLICPQALHERGGLVEVPDGLGQHAHHVLAAVPRLPDGLQHRGEVGFGAQPGGQCRCPRQLVHAHPGDHPVKTGLFLSLLILLLW